MSYTSCEADCVYGRNTTVNVRTSYSGNSCHLTVVQFRLKRYVVHFGKVNDTQEFFCEKLDFENYFVICEQNVRSGDDSIIAKFLS